MIKKILLATFFLHSFSLHSYVSEERLFDTLEDSGSVAVSGGVADGGFASKNVLRVKSAAEFFRDVVQQPRPVVVKVSSQWDDNLEAVYQVVADKFHGRVSFVRAKISDVEGVIRMILMRLGVPQVSLPFFLFFKNGHLLLPLVAGTVTKERLTGHVEARFFSKTAMSGRSSSKYPNLRLRVNSRGELLLEKQKRVSTWEKLEDLGDKIRNWVFGLRDVSREIKAYQHSLARRNLTGPSLSKIF